MLLLRVAVFGGVIFGAFFGLAYAMRTTKQKRLAQEIRSDMHALKTGLAQGLYSGSEVDALTRAIEAKCSEAGIDLATSEIEGASAPADSPSQSSPKERP